MQTRLSVYIRLGAMMFLQYAIWGAWSTVLWPYLTKLGFTEWQKSASLAALYLASILAPFTGGQIADRWLPSQYFLALAHLGGAAAMFFMASQRDFGPFIILMAIYSILFAPTLAVTNAVAFEHIRDREKEFGLIRVLGTLGWIVAGWILTATRRADMDWGGRADLLMLTAVLSFIMAVFCLFLPNTPPKREGENPLAFVEAFKLLKDPQFLLFIIIAFVVTTELQFYYGPTGDYLKSQIGIADADVPAVMTIAQICELVGMAVLLPLLLPKIGIRWALAIGVIAWPIRYIVFAIGTPELKALVLGSLGLHGIGYTFFFVVSFIYVDKVAPSNIRNSAQSLVTLATIGLGNFIGTMFLGYIMNRFKNPDGSMQWTNIFLVPCVLTVICAIAYLVLFRDPRAAPDRGAQEPSAA
ncbi:MAG: MFS transporter [Armatimonadetes bacterium]|nr:MFS transporter [Armatimonadota bacterium]MDI9602537.1 MFS transporter [Acidobacteriota bacterium]